MKKIKVLFIVSNLSAGGQERQLIELLKGLAINKDINCELVIFSHNIHYNDLKKFEINIHYILRRHRKDIIVFFKFFKLCKKIKPDIIHTWGPTPAGYVFLIAKILGIKFINGFIRNAFVPKIFDNNWFRSKLTFPFSDIITSNSKAGLISYGLQNNRKGIVIYNGFDLKRIEHLEDKELIKKSFSIKTKYVIGMVAAFSDKKDYETYIKAANIVLEKKNDVTFVAVGNGPNLDKCKSLVNLIFKDRIKFLGMQEDVESIVNIFDIGVLATYTEGISNSIMEYMALGKPVIATDGGGTNELLINNETGYLVEQGNVEQLTRKMLILLENSEKAKKMGNSGRNRIISKFSLEKMINSYFQLYKNILN